MKIFLEEKDIRNAWENVRKRIFNKIDNSKRIIKKKLLLTTQGFETEQQEIKHLTEALMYVETIQNIFMKELDTSINDFKED